MSYIDISVANQKIKTLRDWIDEVENDLETAKAADIDRPNNQEGMPYHHSSIAGMLTSILTKVQGPVATAVINLGSSVSDLKNQSMEAARGWNMNLGYEGGKRRPKARKAKKTRKSKRSA